MKNAKLILRLEKGSIAKAKRSAREHETSVSRLVANFFDTCKNPALQAITGPSDPVARFARVQRREYFCKRRRLPTLFRRKARIDVLFDTNVVLDALLDRGLWSNAAVALFDSVESGTISGYLGATTMTTIHYIAMQDANNSSTDGMINDLHRLFEVAPVNCAILESALTLGFNDFEDAVLHEAGRLAGAEVVVTRDYSGFSSTLQVYAPDTLVAILRSAE